MAILFMLEQAMKCAIFFFSYIEINHRITLPIKKLSLWSTPGTENTANTGIWCIEIHDNSYIRLLLFFLISIDETCLEKYTLLEISNINYKICYFKTYLLMWFSLDIFKSCAFVQVIRSSPSKYLFIIKMLIIL